MSSATTSARRYRRFNSSAPAAGAGAQVEHDLRLEFEEIQPGHQFLVHPRLQDRRGFVVARSRDQTRCECWDDRGERHPGLAVSLQTAAAS